MKKTLILSLALCVAIPAMADLDGNGFYRVQNMKTKRYVSVVDDKGSVDFVATSADLQAITLQKNFDAISHDAGSVLYIEQIGDVYNISAQGTSVYQIIDHYVHLIQNGTSDGQKVYMAYGVYDGVTRYLGDSETMGIDIGNMSITTTGDYRKWFIKPISADGDNYFGAVPGAKATAGEHQGLFTTLYTSFPYSAYTEGLKFYTIDKFGPWGQVTLKEIKGVVNSNTPVIIKCVGESSSDNRLNVGGKGESVTFNSNLKGVLFNCDKGGKHNNRVKYDFDTMRVLGVCEDGSLGFIQYNVEYIPANTAYLVVPANSPSEFKIVTEEAFSNFDDTVVTLDQSEVTLVEGASVKLNATVTSEYVSTDKKLTWSSSDESVASVKDGVVTALKVGTTQITVTLPNGNSATCDIVVIAKEPEVILVTELILSPSSIENYPGDEIQLTVTVLPEDATDKTVEWSSSNKKVAIVNESGLVTITGEGRAVITVTATDGSGVTATCHVDGLAGIDTVLGDADEADVYTLNGLLLKENANKAYLATLPKGIYILHVSGKAYKVIK